MSQNEKILAYLKSGHTITPLKALELFGVFRLSGRCWDLKQQGHKIITEKITRNGKTFARYSLAKDEQVGIKNGQYYII